MSSNILRIHAVLGNTKALGPGERFALWLQGCEKDCSGCMSPAAKDITGGSEKTIDEIMKAILSEKNLEGVTISGGEPFLQYAGLYKLLISIREKTSLGVIIYTGHYINELAGMRIAEIDAILAGLADIIIDGPYIPELNDGLSLRGSGNQKINLITPRYKDIAPSYYDRPDRKCEIHLYNHEAFMVGIPDAAAYKMWRQFAETHRG